MRVVTRRGYQFSEKTLPEIFVGTTSTGEAWARDSGLDRIKIYPEDQNASGRELKDVTIEWLANFQHKHNPALADDDPNTIKLYVLSLLEIERAKAGIETTFPQGEKRKAVSQKEKKKKGGNRIRKKKQKKLGSKDDVDDQAHETDDSGVNDHEVVAQYIHSDHVPDKRTAARIGRAKGRIALDGSHIPAEVIIEMKEMALRAHISPFFAWEYGQFVNSLPTPPLSQRPIPSSYDPSPPQEPSTSASATTSGTMPSVCDPRGLQDAGGLDPALLERLDKARKERESWPTLEQYMAKYEAMCEEEDMAYLS